jgi:hypothetical protein
MNPILGAILIFVACPVLGGLSLQRWRQWAWLLECGQGLFAVGIAKIFFPGHPEWEIIGLMALAAGRFWVRQAGGFWSTIAGYVLHQPFAGLLLGLFSLIGVTVFRQGQQIRLVLLLMMPILLALLSPRSMLVVLLAAGLSGILFGMEQQRPVTSATKSLKVFRSDSLDDELNPQNAGQAAVLFAELKQQGLPIPPGWIVYPGDDPASLTAGLQPSLKQRYVVRTSVADSQDSHEISDLMTHREIWGAIVQCFELYARSGEQSNIAAIVQPQIKAQYAGIISCNAPTLKAELPSNVAQDVLNLVDRVQHLAPQVSEVEWCYDGKQVWLVRLQLPPQSKQRYLAGS